jgi:hypothetical protein
MWGSWVSKDAELNVDFKNINLYYRQNAHKKSKSSICKKRNENDSTSNMRNDVTVKIFGVA